MGHHYNTVRAVGKNRDDAEGSAISEFLYENGHRHDIRGIEKATLIRKVPPKKQVEEKRLEPAGYTGRVQEVVYVSMVEDPKAPQDQWLEEWEFELHTHA